jgi:hypothetical protein
MMSKHPYGVYSPIHSRVQDIRKASPTCSRPQRPRQNICTQSGIHSLLLHHHPTGLLDNSIVDAWLDGKVTQYNLHCFLNISWVSGANTPNGDGFAIIDNAKASQSTKLGSEEWSSFARCILSKGLG